MDSILLISAMHAKSNATIEQLRKPISWFFALLLLSFGLLTIPHGFEDAFHESLEFIGFALLIIAGLGRIWCSIYIAGRKDKVLITDGPYSLCRNPLYFFSFLGVIGAFLALQSLLLAGVAALLFLLYYHYVIKSEEKRLVELFGESFLAYRQSTPRLWIAPGLYRMDQAERLISTRVIERGLKEVFWFFAAITLIDGLEMLHGSGVLIYAILPF